MQFLKANRRLKGMCLLPSHSADFHEDPLAMEPCMGNSQKALLAGAGALTSLVYYFTNVKYSIRDWQTLYLVLGVARKWRPYQCMNFADWFHRRVQEEGSRKPVMIFEDMTYTWGMLEEVSNQVAHFCVSKGVGKGVCVGLLMDNCPEYMSAWAGVAKAGGVTALLNTNLRGNVLRHSIQVAKVKVLIVGAELVNAIEPLVDELSEQGTSIFVYGRGQPNRSRLPSLDVVLNTLPCTRIDKVHSATAQGVTHKDTLLYIYTSGTTGMPKAAKITHSKFVYVACGFGQFLNISASDRLYTAMPMYHSAAGIIAVGTALANGSLLVIDKKFSAGQFMAQCRKHKVTAVQYIGELCRYLLATPVHPDDAKNQIRVAFGNGLRPDIWNEFKERFGIDRIVELYAATEGAGSYVNVFDEFGSVGFHSTLLQPLLKQYLCKYDVENDELVRDKKGFCVEAKANEPGELLVALRRMPDGSTNYDGFSDKGASDKRLLRGVFDKNDCYFRSGDLLRKDERGFVFFVDRLGDTFRWKGENVATSEVSEAISSFLPNLEPNVYGVQIPGKDGRCGMVAISPLYTNEDDPEKRAEQFDWRGLSRHVKEKLPGYARPLFVRLLPRMQVTGTFKHQKVKLKEEGFSPAKVSDPLFFFDADGDVFVRITAEVYEQIVGGRFRL